MCLDVDCLQCEFDEVCDVETKQKACRLEI
jgi:hypothetical protein